MKTKVQKGLSTEDAVKMFRIANPEYKFHADVFDTDEPRVRKTKWILENRLSEIDRTIFILYLECGNVRDLGSLLNVSKTYASETVKKIEQKIRNEYKLIENEDNF